MSWTIGAWEIAHHSPSGMDGRPHPSRLRRHTRAGFYDRDLDANTLVTYTTHMKADSFEKQAAKQHEATMTLRFSRHDDLLTVLAIIEDPLPGGTLGLSKNFSTQRTHRACRSAVCNDV